MRSTFRWTSLCSALATLTIVAAASQADEPKPSLQELSTLYKDLGLPFPPKVSKLVRYQAGGFGIVNGVVERPSFALAFQLTPGTKAQRPTLLVGVSEGPGWGGPPTEVHPTREIAKSINPAFSGLPLAIQCRERGWSDLAEVLYDQSQKNAQGTPRQELYLAAWSYWQGQLNRANTDRREIAKRLKDLVARDKEFDTEANRALLKSLDLTLAAKKSKPGSIDALIDDLVDYGAMVGGLAPGNDELDEHYARIAKLGFAAVPTLIEHLDDERLTRGVMQGFNNFRSFDLRVEHVVSDLLEGLAGTEINFNWLRRQQGYAVDKEELLKWWAKAQKEGEEAYLVKHYLDPDEGADGGRGERIRQHRLFILKAKYPKRIPELYKAVLDKRPGAHSGSLCLAVLESTLPKKEKIALYLHALENKERRHRTWALEALSKLDPKRFDEALIQEIQGFPRDTDEVYWTSDVVGIVRLAVYCDDPRVWPAVEKAARQAALGLKMEILHAVTFGAYPDFKRHRKEVLALLAGFLDDDALRDTRSDTQLDGPSAGFPYEKIEVRNAVALDMACVLNVPIPTEL
jgi:hypothetical protein